MEVQEKPFIYKGEQYGTRYSYSDIEPELIPKEPGIRVLPAQYYFEKRLVFTLIKRYEPGDHPLFPQGGYDIRDEGGGVHCYYLDEVIIHPYVLKYKKHLEKVAKKTQKLEEKRQKKYQKILKGGKPGRKALTPEQIEAKEKLKAERAGTGKRGRPGLTPEERALREAQAAQRRLISGGKRGRPKKQA